MANSGPKPSKNERMEAARAQARAKREAAEAARRKKSLWTKIGVIVGVVVLVAGGFAWWFFGSYKPNNTFADQGPIPSYGTQYGGVVLDSPTTMVKGDGGTVDVTSVKDAQADPNGTKAPQGAEKDAKPAQIIIYADVLCPHCAEFEDTYSGQIETWLKDKKATVEYRMVNVIPSATNYPARGANALYCVSDAAPQAFLPMITEMYSDQKERTNAELAKLAKDKGAPDVSSCIKNGTYRPFQAFGEGMMAKANVTGTPSVFVNGEYWDGTEDFTQWAQPKIDAADK